MAEGELDGITKALVDCGVCAWMPLDSVPSYRGQPVLNGLFGVPKTAQIETGEPVLMVIMNVDEFSAFKFGNATIGGQSRKPP